MECEKGTDSSTPFKITCKNYPSEFNLDKDIAKEYFRQFGGLKRVIFKPKLRICTVEYSTKEGFLRALNNAGDYKGSIFEISVDTVPEAKKKRIPKAPKPVWLDDNEIEAELKAMSAIGDTTSEDPLSMFALKTDKRKKTRIWDLEATVKKKVKVKESHKEPIKTVSLSEDHLSLINVVLSQSHTTEEKFKVLDARDKLLRIKWKQYDIKKRGATLGTCPDMCPEKERILRVIQHQVSIYEQDSGKSMDHKKAIKQYSRSSADQESPLSHELRPVPILQMTMCYLMHNIIDLIDTPDVNVSEWYHFLWDRTRSIRKDITQQELCCQGAVKLVEQCARFHIHCSARLSGEDPSVFDQKINTENLTKCLQTLKYMYQDLQLKNEHCPNEPEFRAYVILLNLNDGNFLWEVQQLKRKIQSSPEVKFALAVYSALDKNNYVKFFKLVNSTTYLNACLLMRYFVQVRATALKYLVKCYAPRATKILFPLNELTKILSFDDIDSAIDFVQFYGLPLNEEKSHVILDKTTFAMPEIPYVLERSLNVVESKRIYSVGRIVCGEDLPPRTFESHIPQNSFDSNGFLISKDFLEEADLEQASKQLNDELAKSDEVDSTNYEQFTFREDTRSPMLVVSEPIKSITDPVLTTIPANKETNNIFQQPFPPNFASNSIFAQEMVGSSPLRKMDEVSYGKQTNAGFTKASSIFALSPNVPSSNKPPSVFGASVEQVPVQAPKVSEPPKGGFSFNLIQSKKAVESQLPLSSMSKQNLVTAKDPSYISKYFFKQETELQKTNDIEISEGDKTTSEVEFEDQSKLEQFQDTELAKKESNEDMDEPKISEQIENEMVEIETKKLKEEKERREMLKTQEILRNRTIESDVRNVLSSLVLKIHNKIQHEKSILFKKRLRDEKILKVIRIWRKFVINKRKRKVIDYTPVWMNTTTSVEVANELHTSSENMTLSLKKRYKYGKSADIEIKEDEEITKINLFELTYATMKNRYFNLTGTINKSIYWKVVISIPDEQELLHGAQRIEETMGKAFQWKNKHVIEQVKLNNFESATYCIEKQKGLEVQESNANGIIFIAKNFNTFLQRRIFEHLKEFGVFTKVPIVIILQEYDENECKLKALQDAKILSDYIILIDHLTPYALLNRVEEGLVFLASKIEISPPLELDTFYSFIKKYLCSEIWKKANSFAKWNSQYKICLRSPNIVISLYNEALEKLTKIILDRSTKEYANFPDDFKKYLTSNIPDYLPCNYQYFPSFWRTEYYLYNLEKILKKLALPKWHEKWPPSTEFELEVDIAKYCTKAFKNPEMAFYKMMGLLLKDIDPNVNFDDVENILWTNVIELLGLEKLGEINLGLNNTDFENKSIFNQYIVVYNKNEITKYSKSDWFYVNNSLISKKIRQLLREKNVAIPEKKVSFDSLEDINKTIEEVTMKLNRSPRQVNNIQKEINEFNLLLNDLETSISIQKKINSTMGQALKESIVDN